MDYIPAFTVKGQCLIQSFDDRLIFMKKKIKNITKIRRVTQNTHY